jgi:hypothetical protein
MFGRFDFRQDNFGQVEQRQDLLGDDLGGVREVSLGSLCKPSPLSIRRRRALRL